MGRNKNPKNMEDENEKFKESRQGMMLPKNKIKQKYFGDEKASNTFLL
jgi:hypothetical protein